VSSKVSELQSVNTNVAAEPVDLTDHVAQVGGRTLWQSAKNLLTTGDASGNPQATERDIEQAKKNNQIQREGEQQYSDFLYRTQPAEYAKANPTDYALRKAHDYFSDVAVAPLLRGRTEAEKAVIEPGAREIANAGLNAYGILPGGEGVGKTEDMNHPKMGVAAPETGLEEEVAAVGGRTVIPSVPNTGEHPIVNVSPESFIRKVSNVGGHTFPDVVEKYRGEIRAGKPIEPLEIHHDENGNVIFANGRHRAQAAFQEKVPQVPVRVVNRGAGQPPTPPEERYELNDEEPETPRQAIENQGLVYKGELMPGSKVHMFEHPNHPGKTAAMHENEGITSKSVKEKMDSKLKDFGVK
jgi:hypothetical protein